jgi:hypothetical protein
MSNRSIMSLSTRRPMTALTAGACALALGAGLVPAAAPGAVAEQRATVLHADLKPSGDPDGMGDARFVLNKQRRRVCATVTWSNIGTPNAAHIHRRSDGGIVVDLTGSVTGGPKCEKGVSRRLIKKIVNRPGKYYFNVHNAAYPAGAIQGKLHR